MRLINLCKKRFERMMTNRMLTSAFMAMLVAGIIAAEMFLQSLAGQRAILPIFLVSLLVAIGYQPLSRALEGLVGKTFFRLEYERRITINRFAQSIVTILDKEMLLYQLKSILELLFLPKSMIIFLMDPAKKSYEVSLSIGVRETVLKSAGFHDEDPFIKRLISSRHGIEINEADQRYFERRQAVFFLPLIFKDELLGIISLGEKGNERGYNDVEKGYLFTLAVKVSLSLARIKFYEERAKSLLDGIVALIQAIEAKDAYTRGHCERVALIASSLAIYLKLSEREVEDIRIAGILHDIGKIGVAEQILNKKGFLLPGEFDEIKMHPAIGARIVESLPFSKDVVAAIHGHHERYDGRGYPEGLKGENIPLAARILAVADSYEAMTSNRIYRPAMSKENALLELNIGKATQFDPEIVDVFVRMSGV